MDVQTVGLFLGLAINTIGLGVVLVKLVWGSAHNQHVSLNAVERACAESISATEARLMLKLETQITNVGNVTANLHDRMHKQELAAMEARALAAETYMRRDSYHKATDEFKRDVKDAHDDLKTEMNLGFAELNKQVDAVAMSIESVRREAVERTDRLGSRRK